MSGVKTVAVLSFAGVIGLTLLVLGCALPMFGNWSPLFVIAFYITVPIPLLIAKHYSDDMAGTSACIELALFITVGIVVSAFGLPVVLAHSGHIHTTAMFFVQLGNIVMFVTISAYFYLHRNEDNGWSSGSLF